MGRMISVTWHINQLTMALYRKFNKNSEPQRQDELPWLAIICVCSPIVCLEVHNAVHDSMEEDDQKFHVWSFLNLFPLHFFFWHILGVPFLCN